LENVRESRNYFDPSRTGRMEVAYFGLEELETIGLVVMTYVNTECVYAKEIIMFPYKSALSICTHQLEARMGRRKPSAADRGKCVYMYQG
jgi:hypothetical protein